MGSYTSLLFWRSICDLGIACRFIANPAFDWLVCNGVDCDRTSSGTSL